MIGGVRRLAGSVVACGALAACAADVPMFGNAAADGLHHVRTADGAMLDVVLRPALRQPARYRAVVIPGSGCSGLAPIAAAYFRGLANGDVTVLHKRHVDARAWPAPEACPDAFVAEDRFQRWFQDADAFVGLQTLQPGAPLLLIGISEGAELVPLLAQAHPEVVHIAMLAATGADPAAAYEAQAQRRGAQAEWADMRRFAGDRTHDDAERHAGRTLGYWRDLMSWPVTEPLLALALDRRPVWIAFGERDAALPVGLLRQLAARAVTAHASLCIAIFAGADHGLADAAGDGPLQQFLGWLDAAMLRRALSGDCEPLAGSNRVDPIAR